MRVKSTVPNDPRHLSSENNLPMFRRNSPLSMFQFQVKVKEVRPNVALYSHALLRIRVIKGKRSVRTAPPS